MALGERPYLSIGEVLNLLRKEFPDVTISKIRFLESQGLLDPERTPSGYRKFYDDDVERLRWILQQQREHYLPLKVIKGKLASGRAAAGTLDPPQTIAPEIEVEEPDLGPSLLSEPEPLPADPVTTGGVSLTTDELATATGLSLDDVTDLNRFGLISGRKVGGTLYFDGEALATARLAAGFMRFGVEARHLRMYKSAAEREAGFFEQVVLPMLKQRNPRSRRQAVETLGELSQLGQGMRAAMLRQALRELTGP